MKTVDISHEQLLQLLSYDPETGLFIWLKRVGRYHAGSIAGTNPKDGRINLCINYKLVRAHRVAWFYIYGAWPKGEIDHIDGDPTNNRIANLRDVSHAQNMQNRRVPRKGSRTGLMGVKPHRGGFSARIMVSGVVHHLGSFKTTAEAHQAYLNAKRERHPFGTI